MEIGIPRGKKRSLSQLCDSAFERRLYFVEQQAFQVLCYCCLLLLTVHAVAVDGAFSCASRGCHQRLSVLKRNFALSLVSQERECDGFKCTYKTTNSYLYPIRTRPSLCDSRLHVLQNLPVVDENRDAGEPRQERIDDGQDDVKSKGFEARNRNVSFERPLLDYGYLPTVEEFETGALSQKPILLYLPGFDGTYICPFLQFPALSEDFDVCCMTVGMEDRSTFEELKQDVLTFLSGLANETLRANLSSLDEKRKATSNETQETGDAQSWSGSFFQNLFRKGRPNGVTDHADNSTFTPQENQSKETATSKVVKSNKKHSVKSRELYLAGESFGGILAIDVALTMFETDTRRKQDNPPTIHPIVGSILLKGLVLINAATCYDRSQLASKGPPVSNLPKFLYPLGLVGSLLPLFGDEHSFEQLILILRAKALPSVIDTPAREAYMGRVAFSLPTKLRYMPQETLKWRLEEWLEVGSSKVETRFAELKADAKRKMPSWFRTLIIAGEKDLTLPSIAEAERLANQLPSAHVHVVEGAGHASTCGSRVDLAAEIRSHFPDVLRQSQQRRQRSDDTNNSDPRHSCERTAMKAEAAQGIGVMLGLESRYDGANIGLNPIFYWSKKYYRKVKSTRNDD